MARLCTQARALSSSTHSRSAAGWGWLVWRRWPAAVRVLFTDYDQAPLDFVARSAAENGFDPTRFALRLLDWRDLPDEQFPVILGADVIYEQPLVPLVANLLATLLAPGGTGFDRHALPSGCGGFSRSRGGAGSILPGTARPGEARRRPRDRRHGLPRHAARSLIGAIARWIEIDFILGSIEASRSICRSSVTPASSSRRVRSSIIRSDAVGS